MQVYLGYICRSCNCWYHRKFMSSILLDNEKLVPKLIVPMYNTISTQFHNSTCNCHGNFLIVANSVYVKYHLIVFLIYTNPSPS